MHAQKAVGISLDELLEDFLLSREAILCSPATMKFYRWTGGKIIDWLAGRRVDGPDAIEARHVRAYLSEMRDRGCKPSYIHSHARVFRTLLRFSHEEGYASSLVTFQMPTLDNERLPVLTAREFKQALKGCRSLRDKCLLLFMVDTGARRAETVALNWGDVDLKRGVVHIARGKGGKARTVVTGATTRRSLLRYRRIVDHDDNDPLFQTETGTRLTARGLRSALVRISDRTDVDISPHALRRTFATLSLRAGMPLLQLQQLLGHSTMDMTRRYARLVDTDLVAAHRNFGPVDTTLRNSSLLD